MGNSFGQQVVGSRMVEAPLCMESLVETRTQQQWDLRKRIHRWLVRGTGPYPMGEFSKVLGEKEVSVTIERVGDGIPLLSEPFVAIAICTSRHQRGGVICVPVGLVEKLIGRSLNRPAGESGQGVSTFDNGVLLQLVDSALGDWLGMGYPRVEIRGVLDSREQVKQYLNIGSKPVWCLQAQLTGNGLDGDFCIVGCSGLLGCDLSSGVMDFAQVATLPTILRLIVGHCAVGVAALNQIRVGDVLVLDSLGHPLLERLNHKSQNDEFQMQSGYYTVTARWMDVRSLRIEKVGSMSEFEQSNTISLEQPLDAASGGLEVALQVEVARSVMTVEQVMQLVPGQILKLNQPVPTHVVVRAKDKSICKGQLVQVDGELAVEVTEVL